MELYLRFPIRLHGVMMQYSQRLDLCFYLYHSLVIRKRRPYQVLVAESQEKSPRRISRHVPYNTALGETRREDMDLIVLSHDMGSGGVF
jgi:hypothetical protein